MLPLLSFPPDLMVRLLLPSALSLCKKCRVTARTSKFSRSTRRSSTGRSVTLPASGIWWSVTGTIKVRLPKGCCVWSGMVVEVHFVGDLSLKSARVLVDFYLALSCLSPSLLSDARINRKAGTAFLLSEIDSRRHRTRDQVLDDGRLGRICRQVQGAVGFAVVLFAFCRRGPGVRGRSRGR